MAILRVTIQKEEGETTSSRFKIRVKEDSASRMLGKLIKDLQHFDLIEEKESE